MKNKKSLFSVLLAALLLATCVAGMLIFSASAGAEVESSATHVYIVRGASQGKKENTWTGETPTPDPETGNPVFQTVIGAMYHAKQQETWENGTSLEIQLDVPTFTVTQRTGNNLIFSAATQAPKREDGSVLPVTITKHKDQTGPVTIRWSVCGWLYNGANLTFKNLILDFTYGSTVPQISCGGQLEFNNVEIKADIKANSTDVPYMMASANTKGCYPFSSKAEYDKLDDKDGLYTASITFSGTTTVPAAMEIRGVGKTNSTEVPNPVSFTDGTSVARTNIGGKIVVKDNATIYGSINGMANNYFGFSIIELLGGTVKGNVTGVGYAITANKWSKILLDGTNVEQEVLGNSGYSMAAGCKSTVLYRSGSAASGIKGAAGASKISGTVEVIIEGDCSQKVYGFGGSKETEILSGGKVNLIVNSGTVTGAFRLNSDNQYVVKTGGEAAAYFNGGTVDADNYSVFRGGGKTVQSGFQDGSVLRVEWNGTTFVDHGATETGDNLIYPIYQATLACDVHFTVTKLNTTRERMFIRYLNQTVINGDVYLTLDTTEDGAEDPSDVVKEGQEIIVKGYFQDYSTQVNGNSYTKINGGNKPESISIANLTVPAGVAVDNDIYNCVITNEFGINRGGAGTSNQIVNDFKNVDATNAMVICAAQHYYAYRVTGTVSSSFENCKIKQLYADIYALGSDLTAEDLTASFSANLKGCEIGSVEGALEKAEITLEGNNVISGRIVKKRLVLASNSRTEISGDCVLLAEKAGTNVTVHKADPWDSFDTVYVSAPAYSDITVTDAEENRAPYILEDRYEVRGWYPTVYATFILEDRIYVKLSVDPAVAESFAKEADGVPFEVIYKDEEGKELVRFTLEQLGAEGGYLLAAEGAGDFNHILYYSLNGEEIFTTTLVDVAESGKTYYTEQKMTEIANLFSAIASYGKAALDTPFEFPVNDLLAIQRYGNNEANIDPKQFSVDRKIETIDFDSIHLLMGDTVGLRLRVSAETQAALRHAKLYLVDAEGNWTALAEEKQYIKNEDSLDIFIHAKDYETFAHLIVTYEKDEKAEKEENICLDLNASVSYLMYEMVKGDVTTPSDPSKTTLKNTQLQATALFIVRTNEYLDYLAEQDYEHPKVPEDLTSGTNYVGYARGDITPSYSITIYDGPAYTARDSLMLTCTAVSDGVNIALIMSADLKGIDQSIADNVIEMIEKEYEIPRERIIISATHTHSAPTITVSNAQAKWNSYFYRQTLKVVGQAIADLSPVEKALAGKGYTENVNFVRRYKLESGAYQTNASTTQDDLPIAHESEADNEVRVIRFVREGKKDVLIMNFQTHYGLYEQTYSADFVHLLRKWAEEQDEDLHFAYYSGASGNLNMTPKFKTDGYDEFKYNKVNNEFSKGDTAYGRVEEMWRVAKAALEEAETNRTTVKMGQVVGATRFYQAEIGYESDKLAAAADALYEIGSGSDETTKAKRAAKLAELLAAFEGTAADKATLEKYGTSYRWAQGVVTRASLREKWEDGYHPIPFTAIAFGEIAFTSSPIEQFDANAKWVRENSPFGGNILTKEEDTSSDSTEEDSEAVTPAEDSSSNTTTVENYVVVPSDADKKRQEDAYGVSNFNSAGELKGDSSTTNEAQSFVYATDPYKNGMTFTMSLANGSWGYVPTAFAFPHEGYEVYVSRYVAGSGEEFALAQLDLLNRCYNAQQEKTQNAQ